MNRLFPLESDFTIRWALTLCLAAATCAAPLCLWGLPQRWNFLKLDDFVYLARSRARPSLVRFLMTPHNGHVVPLYLVETHLLCRLAGSLARLPWVLSWACYGNLIVAAAMAGHLVVRETGRPARGLAVMAAVGLSTVLGPALLWYAASQSLAAGTAILAMLAALQIWRARGKWPWMALALFAAMAAPLFWTPGYTAGLAGFVYLWSDRRRSCRLAAVAPLAASALTAGLVWCAAGPEIARSTQFVNSALPEIFQLPRLLTHVTQAISEKLLLNNLGLDAPTAPVQSVVLSAGLLALWVWTRRARGRREPGPLRRPNPLETAGAALILANYALVFAARGREMTYDNLRALGWYDCIPLLGAALFAAGWRSGRIDSPPRRSVEPPHIRELLGVAAFAGAMLLLQLPRAQRVIFLYDGMAAEMHLGEQQAPGTQLKLAVDLAERARLQRQALVALDQVERSAGEQGSDLLALQRALDQVAVPGMPAHLPGLKTSDLLDVPWSSEPAVRSER
jgi:hypothetical protein